ncbi:hypothetical protein LOTGIDRAFT_121567 [Lottia gigantea]|uniref:Potassium channel domain-containing protein n=1 Tax=Lottia gigantea TaxID=225164 RepID=V3ZKS8_LOTGI|nr:hypothetical protein LOTGIDRAFT_121567 [Lottia gigantea]ESO91953.1 hypothetical protein LOTGIDRAFT_121567 [Lottia gigantea]
MDGKKLFLLIILLVIYLSLGSVMFRMLEGSAETDRQHSLDAYLIRFLANHSCVTVDELQRLLTKATEDSVLVHFALQNETRVDRWDFSGAFAFAVSVVTTIGYGNMAPYTLSGKAATVGYALIGIPITLILLNALGEKLAAVFAKINKLKLCSKSRPSINKSINMLLIVLFGVMLMFVAPGFIFTIVEEWNFLETLYFCFITLSTIGFGDYIIGKNQCCPEKDVYTILAYVWILFGLAYLALVIKYITDVLLKKASKVVNQRHFKRMEVSLILT